MSLAPAEAPAGARQKYVVRMPNEKKVDTVRLELRVPARLVMISIQQVPDWAIEVERGADGRALAVRWSGRLPPEQFAEFGLMAKNPDSAGIVHWLAVQTYADGQVVEWTGEADSKTPAPQVSITPAPGQVDHPAHR